MHANNSHTQDLFDISGQVAVVTGGAGVLCSYLCRVLADAGVKVAILDINYSSAERQASDICHSGGKAVPIKCDVCRRESLQSASESIISSFGKVDILINGAGGNHPRATISPKISFFDLPADANEWVIDLNFMTTIYASQVFGRLMAVQKKGIILNISSMNALRPLTTIPAYSAAKAAVSNFTQWLAVYMALEYSPEIRVNAIAPGFFLGTQNRNMLIDQISGELTDRGRKILEHTPMKRFGDPANLAGTVLWLLSPASRFVTGIVVPIDGGFSAFSGV
jgi:NAD(P)-dependent dehydrogenase (short-subunit alcohol dehydrogenase family)